MHESPLPVSVQPGMPGTGQRWRCGGCGNLTRFDVVRTRRTQEFWHADLAGDGQVEETAVLAESVEAVTCRWSVLMSSSHEPAVRAVGPARTR
jgi:hypothetical protein